MATVISGVTNVSYSPRVRSVFVQERLEKCASKKSISISLQTAYLNLDSAKLI